MSFTKKTAGYDVGRRNGRNKCYCTNNNTGEIVIQGVVPGSWELTVYDINSGYDFDLSAASIGDTARVGTIHVFTNDTDPSGLGTGAGAQLFIESANAGRMINDQSIPGIAADNQQYTFDLVENVLTDSTGIVVNATSNLDPANANTHDLVVPALVDFDSAGGGATLAEATYDVEITLAGALPQASGVYTDTITFTIMDDN